MRLQNRQYRLAARPVGMAKASDWTMTIEPVTDPEAGQVLVKVLMLSLDPAMRGWISEGRSYIAPVGIGEVMRAIGIAGEKAKCDFVTKDLRFDACIDYKAGPQAVRDGLKAHCPRGVDVYCDNVGGEILDTVLARINRGARIVLCGAISQYNNTAPVKGPANYLSLLINRARMQGMAVFDYAERYGEAVRQIAQWMKEGIFISREDVVPGIENFPATMNKLFSGGNFGKLVLEVAKG